MPQIRETNNQSTTKRADIITFCQLVNFAASVFQFHMVECLPLLGESKYQCILGSSRLRCSPE